MNLCDSEYWFQTKQRGIKMYVKGSLGMAEAKSPDNGWWNRQAEFKPPPSFKVIFVLTGIHVFFLMFLILTGPIWAATSPDTVHSYPIRFPKVAGVYFVQPWLEKYLMLVGIELHAVFMVILLLIFWRHRKKSNGKTE